MKFRLTISIKIWVIFTVVIASIIGSSMICRNYYNKIRRLDRIISEIYLPSVAALGDLNSLLQRCTDWQSMMNSNDSLVHASMSVFFREARSIRFPRLDESLIRISRNWPGRDQQEYIRLSKLIGDSLLIMYGEMASGNPLTPGAGNASLSGLEASIMEVQEETGGAVLTLLNRYRGLLRSTDSRIVETDEMFSRYLILMSVIVSLIALLSGIILIRSLVTPVNRLKLILQEMARGKLPEGEVGAGSDEVGQMSNALNSLTMGLKALSTFAEEIGKGNYEGDFKPLGDKDTLGNALLQMREDLKNAAEEETKRKKEDEIRNWSNHGIARFSEILREHTDDIQQLSEAVIGNLVKYLDARVGALFLVNTGETENQSLVLTASYAFDRLKHLKKEIVPGEGLAGRCLQEGETIYMTEIPKNYLSIKSGLGADDPRSILIVPLKLHEEIIGVVELASFEEMEAHKIEFVERMGTSIASTISAIRAALQRRTMAPHQVSSTSGQDPEKQDGQVPGTGLTENGPLNDTGREGSEEKADKSEKGSSMSPEEQARIRKKLDELTGKKK